MSNQQAAANRGKLTRTVGSVTAAALLTTMVPNFEGMVLRGYKDPIGIVTACAGHTKTAILGKAYSREECDAMLIDDLLEHAQGVKACVTAPLTPGQMAASVSFAYNVGVRKFCTSTMAKLLNAQQFEAACAQLSRWTTAGGKQLKGLVTRRAAERAVCEGNY